MARIGPDHLIWPRPNADQRNRDADELGHEPQVLPSCVREFRLRVAVAQILAPPPHLQVLASGVVKDRLVIGEVLELRALGAPVARAYLQAVDAGEEGRKG